MEKNRTTEHIPMLLPKCGEEFFDNRGTVYDSIVMLWNHIQLSIKVLNHGLDIINEQVAINDLAALEAKDNGEKAANAAKQLCELSQKIKEAYDIAKQAADNVDIAINGTSGQNRFDLMMTNYAIRKIAGENEYEVYFAENDADFITRYVHLDKGMKIRVDATGGNGVVMKLYSVLNNGEQGNKVVESGSRLLQCESSNNGVLEYNVVLTGNYVVWLSDGANYLIEPTDAPVDQPVPHKPAASIVVEDKGLAGIHDAVADLERRMNEGYQNLIHSFENAIRSISVGGIALTDQFGDSEVLGITQKFLSEKLIDLQGTVNELVVGGMTITLSASPSVIFVGESKAISVNASISDTAQEITISGGNIATPVVDMNKKTASASDTVMMNTPATTTYNAQFVVKGVTQNRTASVRAVYPIYKGFGASATEVAVDANKLSARTSAAGTYTGTAASSGVHYYILVPDGIGALNNFSMNATPFVMNASTTTIGGVSYKVYESGSAFDTGGEVNIVAN